MIDPFDLKLIDRWLAGEASEEEEIQLFRWKASAPERARLVEAFEVEWRRSHTGDVDAAWSRLMTQRGRTSRPSSGEVIPLASRTSPASRVRSSRRFLPLMQAASVIMLFAAGALIWRLSPPATPQWKEVTALRGQLANIELADGTRVVIGPESSLRYPLRFGRDAREVRLDGAAYFEVSSRHGQPFLVHAAHSMTEVLGTRFAVWAYSDEPVVSITVTEGQVAFRASDETGHTVLSRGDVGRLIAAGAVSVTHNENIDDHVAWIRGDLTFQEAPLAEVAVRLGRAYDLKILIADSALVSRRFTGTLKKQPVADILTSLSIVLDMKYERVGDRITFSRGST